MRRFSGGKIYNQRDFSLQHGLLFACLLPAFVPFFIFLFFLFYFCFPENSVRKPNRQYDLSTPLNCKLMRAAFEIKLSPSFKITTGSKCYYR